MKMPKFTRTKVRAAHKCVINEQVKNYAIVLLITLSFTLITNLQTSAGQTTQA